MTFETAKVLKKLESYKNKASSSLFEWNKNQIFSKKSNAYSTYNLNLKIKFKTYFL